jgi:outer membrane protein insertion porin family
LTQRWSAGARVRVEDVDVYNAYQPAPPILQQAIGYHLLSTGRANLIHDTRDAAFAATAGHYVEMAYEQAFGQYNFSRFELEGRQYFTTYQRIDGGGKHTLLLYGQMNYTGHDTPIFERYFAGGMQSFRGFQFRGVSPYQGGVYTGGDFMFLGSVEYSMPVLANEMVRVVGFTDFGTVNDGLSFANMRVSVGGGFRVKIPAMGPAPIAVDFAVPIMQDPTDIKQLVSFFIGANR